ncbi:transient receptor potential cation channel subfamily M member 2 isoform X2 [Lepisosteus oculatus]
MLPGSENKIHPDEPDGKVVLTAFEKRCSIKSWIKQNIKKKECIYYVEASSKAICKCGYQKTSHSGEALKPDEFLGELWDPRKHVREVPTDAFGDITFPGLGQKVGKYVRVSSDSSTETLYQLMTEFWGLSPPNLLISVTGGAKNFYMKSRLKVMFRRGLIKVAHTTGAWIVTGGTHAGVMKHVGKAVRDYSMSTSSKDGQIVAIGIATWGTVHNRQNLIDPEGKFSGYYPLDETSQGRLSCLDINHSHFILVDDGTHGKYGVEIALRSKLEKLISEQPLGNRDGSVTIPAVCVVLEGGPGTLNTIYNAVINGTPCVILGGSGRIADVIAQLANLPVSQVTVSLIKKQLKRFFSKEYDTFSELKIIEWTKKIQDIIRMQQLLTVFRIDEEGRSDVDVAILKALLKASKASDSLGHGNWERQLELAVAWNRVDIAESEIFTEDRQWKSSDLHQATLSALIGNRTDFVKLLLENGVSLKEFLTEDILLELYNNLLPGSLILRKIAKRLKEEKGKKGQDLKGKQRITLSHVSEELRLLLGSYTQPLYPLPAPRRRFEIPNHDIRIMFDSKSQIELQDIASTAEGKTLKTLEDPARDLFLWAILQNRKELAEIAWEQCRDNIAAALAASKILKILAEEEEGDESDEMKKLADYYEHQAIGVFTECYGRDELRAQKLLTRLSKSWGRTTCLRLALEADNKSFVAQTGVQAFLTTIWWGELTVDTKLWRVLLCMLFFPFIYTGLVTFRRDEEIQKEIQRNKEIDGLETMAFGHPETKLWTNFRRRQEQVILVPLSFIRRFKNFFTSPVVTFYWNVMSYFGFLWLFAYVLMMDFQVSPSWTEILLYVWLASLLFEEIRQLFHDPDGFGVQKKAQMYFNDTWNKVDMLSIFIFIAGLSCRLTTTAFYDGRIILCFGFIIFCLRLMAIFAVSKTLGPKIIIVKRMMKDIFFFLFLLGVWVVAYGVAMQSILIHNETQLNWIFRGAVYEPYLTIFGNIPSRIDSVNFDNRTCSLNGDDPLMPKCPVLNADGTPAFPDWLTIILLCVYLLFANILLLNLLIAMFNYTFQEVQDHTDNIWKFQRYQLIEEYHSRPSAPPPFIIFSHIFFFIRRIILRRPSQRHKMFHNELSAMGEAELLSWETFMKENYLASQKQERNQSTEYKIHDTAEKVGVVVDLLEGEHNRESASLVKRLAKLEEQVSQSTKALQWIMNALKSNSLETKEDATFLSSLSRSTEAERLDLDEETEKEKPQCHVNATHLPYPGTSITRFPVPEEYVPWEVAFPAYNPVVFTARKHSMPSENNTGSSQGLITSSPVNYKNPVGRTGLEGSGSLYQLGPNKALDPVITRWKVDSEGSILEFIAVRNKKDEIWAFPGGILQPGETLPERLKEVVGKKLQEKIESMLHCGIKVYQGYVDDCRNTDNAWVETTAINIHFNKSDSALDDFIGMTSFRDSSSGLLVEWEDVSDRIALCAYQKDILRMVAELHNIQL